MPNAASVQITYICTVPPFYKGKSFLHDVPVENSCDSHADRPAASCGAALDVAIVRARALPVRRGCPPGRTPAPGRRASDGPPSETDLPKRVSGHFCRKFAELKRLFRVYENVVILLVMLFKYLNYFLKSLRTLARLHDTGRLPRELQ